MMEQKNVSLVVSSAVATLIAGCITVHIYFPAKELRKAADEIVEEVRPEIASAGESPSDAEGDGTAPSDEKRGEEQAHSSTEDDASATDRRDDRSPAHRALLAVAFFDAAWAEDDDSEKDDERVIKTSSAKIVKIKASLKARYKLLLPLYVGGHIGEGLNGYLALREVKDLSLKDRRDVTTLVKAENADRENLYAAIARENGIADDKIKDIGRIFSRSWQKTSKTGWWIEVKVDKEGKKTKWVKKPKPRKSEKPSVEKSESAA